MEKIRRFPLALIFMAGMLGLAYSQAVAQQGKGGAGPTPIYKWWVRLSGAERAEVVKQYPQLASVAATYNPEDRGASKAQAITAALRDWWNPLPPKERNAIFERFPKFRQEHMQFLQRQGKKPGQGKGKGKGKAKP